MKRPNNQTQRVSGMRTDVPHASTNFFKKSAFWGCLSMLMVICQLSFSQSQLTSDVTGTVLTEKGEILQGATVSAENTKTKVVSYSTSDNSGIFLFRKLTVGDTYDFKFSFLGYEPGELGGYQVKAGQKNSVMVRLKVKNAVLGQVVVTALGVLQKKAALGYSTQEVKGAVLNEARDNNFVNSMAGRVAGVNVISGNGVGASGRITIRGESSLNYFKNQPLIVIDGVPVSNDPVSNTGGGLSPDYGSTLDELNPADIESVNVLKGAAAAALYGSRAANGALVITTKSGAGHKGIGVSVTSGYTWENPLRLPKFQNSYGGGNDGNYSGSNFGFSNNGLYPNGVNEDWDESWGPALDGRLITQFDGPTSNGFRGADVNLPDRGDITPTPWVPQPNNMKDFFVTGHTIFNSVALLGSTDVSTFRFSYTNNIQNGIVPNNDLTRNVFNLNASFKMSDRLTATVVSNYTKTNSSSRPNLGYGQSSPMYEYVWFDRNVNINSLRNYWQPGAQGLPAKTYQFSQDYGNAHDNPFFYAYENTSAQNKDQLYGNFKLTYKILDNLTIMGRAGTDYFNDFRPSRVAFSTLTAPQGSYNETTLTYQENNYDFLVNYKKEVKDFTFDLSGGGNIMQRRRGSTSISAPTLVIPGIYSLQNTGSALQYGGGQENRRTNSLYAFLNTDWQGKIFLNFTARNDWSSTLPANNNSYFYPSVNTSILFNRIFNMSEKIDLLKLRVAYAQAGNDADPYSILTPYSYMQPLWNGLPGLSENSSLNNQNLKPEKSSTTEVGVEFSLFKGRLGLDVTGYNTSSKNQILNLPVATSSGYTNEVINAAEIQNRGVEVQLSVVPIQGDFTWSFMINFAKNNSKVINLAPGVDRVIQLAPGEDAQIVAAVGQRMGALYGPGFVRVPDGPLKGEPIIGTNGRAQITGGPSVYLGNINPDWTMGIANHFSYKGIHFDFLFDINHGGVLVSRFINKAMGAGQLLETAGARLKHAPDDVYNTDYFRQGGVLQPDGSYAENLQIFDGSFSKGLIGTSARDFYKRYYDHNSEQQSVDRSFVKLREVKIGYTFPKKMYSGLPIQSITFSLVGRNLLLWTKNDQFDPETGASTGSGLVGGFENLSLPSTRSYGMNLNINF